MSAAVLERFADPSRRCDPDELEGDSRVWNLPGRLNDPAALRAGLPRAVGAWLTDVPRGERRDLLRACLRTRGARAGALLRAPELWQALRAGEIDQVACFTTRDFGLADFLAGRLGSPCRELLASETRYFGEFAFELLAVIPYAYWLHRQGLLERTVSTSDTRCLYYFSPQHEERSVERRYVAITDYPVGEPGVFRYDPKALPSSLDTRRWLPPPYRDVFRDGRFRWDRPTCVVSNKASDERYLRRGFSCNALDRELLLAVVGRLRERYQVVYNRPRAEDIVNDDQEVREPGDIEAVQRAFPDVLTIQDLHASSPGLTFNELQLRLYSGCERFVSVLGGGSYLASYFGGTNVVYARRGWEVSCGAYESWFGRFSGARIVAAAKPRDLLRAVEQEHLPRRGDVARPRSAMHRASSDVQT